MSDHVTKLIIRLLTCSIELVFFPSVVLVTADCMGIEKHIKSYLATFRQADSCIASATNIAFQLLSVPGV